MKTSLNRLRTINGETVFTVILLMIAVYLFVEALTFSERAATFPRTISGAAIVGCVLLLISEHLPPRIRSFIQEDARIIQHDEEQAPAGDDEPADVDGPKDQDLRPTNSAYAVALIAGYLIIAYLAGFFVGTPLFVLAYILVFDINRVYGAGLLIASIAIVYGFERALNVPLNEGLIFTVGI